MAAPVLEVDAPDADRGGVFFCVLYVQSYRNEWDAAERLDCGLSGERRVGQSLGGVSYELSAA